jgi:hypothetical protein
VTVSSLARTDLTDMTVTGQPHHLEQLRAPAEIASLPTSIASFTLMLALEPAAVTT